MKRRITQFTIVTASIAVIFFSSASAQTNIISTNPVAEQIMLGNYDPAIYAQGVIRNHPDTIINGILSLINTDSLQSYLEKLASFQNRNSGSDTVSPVKGIGAARRWVYQKFQQFSVQNNNRLIPSYLQFDRLFCGAGQHRNPMAVLPGIDTTDPSIIIIESHLDSRCEGSCDTACVAEGVDDNGSGTALVIELARVLSEFHFSHTIVFTTNTGEEQGLYGAEAFADYVTENGIIVKTVLNNDIVGGVLCGETSSPPSCSPQGDIDSTQIRLFSYGGTNSPHKGLVRFIKLEYRENLLPLASVPMDVAIMTAEDRTGRGGDHIPFREHGFTAMRFTSANENGNADVNDPDYEDNQHTSRDVLGYDTDGDLVIDSFLVDMNYLKRNSQINGNAASMAAIGPKTPDFTFSSAGSDLQTTITSQTQYPAYRVGVRTITYDFDSVYTINAITGTVALDSAGLYYVSVASVDTNGIESLFSGEQIVNTTGINEVSEPTTITLLPAKPNPFDDAAMISFLAGNYYEGKEATIAIYDTQGILIKELPLTIHQGLNEILYKHGRQFTATLVVQLRIGNQVIATNRIVFSR